MAYVTASLISQNGFTFFHPFQLSFSISLHLLPFLLPLSFLSFYFVDALSFCQKQVAPFPPFLSCHGFVFGNAPKNLYIRNIRVTQYDRRTTKSNRYPPAVQPIPIPCWCHHQRSNAPRHDCLRSLPRNETSRLSNPDGPKGDETTQDTTGWTEVAYQAARYEFIFV